MDNFIAFTYLRPVFFTFLTVLSFLLINVVFNQTFRSNNKLFTIGLSLLSFFICGMILFIQGTIVDELNMSGDSVSFDLFLAIACVSIANIVISFLKTKKGDMKTL